MHKNSPIGFSRPRKEELAKRRRRGGLAKDFFSVIGKFFLSAKFFHQKPGSEFLWLATPSQCQCFFLFFFHSYNKRTAFSRHPNAEAQPDSETNASMEMDSCLFVSEHIFPFFTRMLCRSFPFLPATKIPRRRVCPSGDRAVVLAIAAISRVSAVLRSDPDPEPGVHRVVNRRAFLAPRLSFLHVLRPPGSIQRISQLMSHILDDPISRVARSKGEGGEPQNRKM